MRYFGAANYGPELGFWEVYRCRLGRFFPNHGALAHLQLGRARVLRGDTAKPWAAYQDFLALWKDADPGIPILQQAKAEYAKLK